MATTDNDKLTGLFFGAGASYEVGLQLVWELTSEITEVLSRERLDQLRSTWQRQGVQDAAAVLDAAEAILRRGDVHYESLLGNLEVEYRRELDQRESTYHRLYGWIVELVYLMLYNRQIKNVASITRRLRFFEGLRRLVSDNRPLWVFSANHDVILECLAAAFDLPISSGFGDETIQLPLRAESGDVEATLRAKVLRGADLNPRGMRFLEVGETGINLLKLHGALDVFTFRDGADLLKLEPMNETPEGVFAALRAVNERLPVTDPVRPINEICYRDETGEVQFLRRTLLSGAFKFDARTPQVLPDGFLDLFRVKLHAVDRLVAIGYGFGDAHLNRPIRDWLEVERSRELEIVDPFRTRVPDDLLHLAPQVRLVAQGATDYLDGVAGITRTRSERLEKSWDAWWRKNQKQVTQIIADARRRYRRIRGRFNAPE